MSLTEPDRAMTDCSLGLPAGVVGGFVARAGSREGTTALTPTPQTSDQQAAAQTLAGDRAAFETLVLRYERAIYAHLLRITGRPEDAEDLTQETFLKAFRGLAGYRPALPFRAWLYRIATNTAISALRRRGPVLLSLDGAGPDAMPLEIADPKAVTPAERLGREELLAELERAIAELPAAGAALISLRYHEELSLEEIGLALGRKPGAVAVAIHRLRHRLRELIFTKK